MLSFINIGIAKLASDLTFSNKVHRIPPQPQHNRLANLENFMEMIRKITQFALSVFWALSLVGIDSVFASDKRCNIDGCAVIQGLKSCTQCRKVHYCGQEHQKLDWKSHQKVCQVSPEHLERAREKFPIEIEVLESISKIGLNFSDLKEARSADGEIRSRHLNLSVVPHPSLRNDLAAVLIGDEQVGAALQMQHL